jgi:hypothetical protein
VIGVVIVSTEIVLRKVVGVDPTTDRMATYQFDSTLGWTTRHDFKFYRSSLYYGQFNYYGPEGFPTTRDAWHTRASTSSPSIAFLGSSFVESYYVPYEESFPYHVKEATGKQVLNLGVSGYAPDQYLLRARTTLPQYNVTDIVAVLFPINDLPGIATDQYQGFAKPYFKDNLDTPVNMPLHEPELTQKETGVAAEIRSTALYTLLRPIVRKAIGINLKESTKMPQTFDPKKMDNVFKIFAELKKEHPSARLLIYEIPFYKEVANDALYSANTKLFMDTCARYELFCASMDPIIRAHKNMSELFIEGDGHVSAYGAKLVADQMAQLLTETASTSRTENK